MKRMKPEIEEAHKILDTLMSGSRNEPLEDRLRQFLTKAAGDRVACLVNTNVGRTLATYHLKHSGHPENCPCNPCRDARRLK